MNGGPADPISFERAVGELWELLAVRAGLKAHLFGSKAQASEIADERQREIEEELSSLHEKAFLKVHILISFERIPVWVEDAEVWKHPMPADLHDRLVFDAVDVPKGLYVDRQQIKAVAAEIWPEEFAADQSPSGPNPGMSRKKRNVGRPRGPGYSLKDVPVFELILKAQRQSGDVETQHGLITRFAGGTDSASLRANVDRLRKGLPRWLEENGHKWRRSK